MRKSHLQCSEADVEAMIGRVLESRAATRNRFTPIRLRVLHVLMESAAPTSAYDIRKLLRPKTATNMMAIYRALNFLIMIGLVHRIATLDAFLPCQHWKHLHTPLMLLCQRCGRAEELVADAFTDDLAKAAQSVGFTPRDAIVELLGACRNCA